MPTNGSKTVAEALLWAACQSTSLPRDPDGHSAKCTNCPSADPAECNGETAPLQSTRCSDRRDSGLRERNRFSAGIRSGEYGARRTDTGHLVRNAVNGSLGNLLDKTRQPRIALLASALSRQEMAEGGPPRNGSVSAIDTRRALRRQEPGVWLRNTRIGQTEKIGHATAQRLEPCLMRKRRNQCIPTLAICRTLFVALLSRRAAAPNVNDRGPAREFRRRERFVVRRKRPGCSEKKVLRASRLMGHPFRGELSIFLYFRAVFPGPEVRTCVQAIPRSWRRHLRRADRGGGDRYGLRQEPERYHAGQRGEDTFDAGPGDDLVDGRGGDDFLRGRSGNHLISGGTGNDTMTGNAGNAMI